MSKIEGTKCDKCNKITFDCMLDKWIHIEGTFAKYGGRNKNEAFCEIFLPSKTGGYHFCSWECLQDIKKRR